MIYYYLMTNRKKKNKFNYSEKKGVWGMNSWVEMVPAVGRSRRT